jgi:hypothetical protein
MLKKFFGGGRVWGVGKWGSGEVGKWGVGCRVLAIFRGKVPEFSPGSLQ